MKPLFVTLVMVSLTFITCEATFFSKIAGFRINTTLWQTTLSVGDEILCCYQCIITKGCKAVNYNPISGECEAAAETPYFGNADLYEISQWDVYLITLKEINGWELLFRTSTGNGISPYNAWDSSSYSTSSTSQACQLMTNVSCPTLFRNPLIDDWESLGVKEVTLKLFVAGITVAHIRFNGTGTKYKNWFSPNTLIDSGWSQLQGTQSFQVFSLGGKKSRTFFIQASYGGCEVDAGWMVVHDDAVPRPFTCNWDNVASSPEFHYSVSGNSTVWQAYEFGKAEVLAIFFKR